LRCFCVANYLKHAHGHSQSHKPLPKTPTPQNQHRQQQQQAYWRREKVEEPPDAARTAEALRVLREDAGLSDAELPRAVKAFPEVVGCAPAALRANLDKLRADWKLEGQVLAKAVARQPAVLGYTIDCLGDCAGECNRCWARF
jgi:hypothetical protein